MHKIEKKEEGFVAKIVGVIKKDPLIKPFVKEKNLNEEEEFQPEGL